MEQGIRHIEFSYSECGVPFLINAGRGDFLHTYHQGAGPFTTDFFELYFFDEDTGSVEVDGQIIPLRASTVLFLSPAHRRKWHTAHTRFDFLLFVEDFLGSFMADKYFVHRLQYCFQYTHPITLSLETEAYQYLRHLVGEIQTELKHINRDSEPILSSILSYLLLYLNRLYCTAYSLPNVRAEGDIAFRFKALVEGELYQHRSADYYAETLGVSRPTLDKILKRQFGLTASQLIRRRLLVELKNELLYTSHTTQEIAYKLGFSEANHMMRFFKSMTSTTIGQWLEMTKSGSPTPQSGSN